MVTASACGGVVYRPDEAVVGDEIGRGRSLCAADACKNKSGKMVKAKARINLVF
jgi:hypothetical protein